MQQSPESSIIYGKNAVTELLRGSQSADTVLLSENLDEKTAGYFTALAKNAGAVVKHIPVEKLDAYCGGQRHQGVAAFTAQIEYCTVEDIIAKAEQQGSPPFLLLLDGVEDPHNLGALLRSALLCGAHGVVIPKRGGSAVTPVAVKASAGAALHLPVARVANIGEVIRRLKKQNLFVYCADMQGEDYTRQNLTGPIALVMGAEGKGVSALVKKLCDGSLRLPMASTATGVDSFNVSVAGGILLHEIFRQRNGR